MKVYAKFAQVEMNETKNLERRASEINPFKV